MRDFKVRKSQMEITKSANISIGNSMICGDIWHKYHEWYFEILLYVISLA